MKTIATSLKARIAYVKERFGEEAFQKVVDSLSEEDKKIVGSFFIPTTDWIPIDTLANFLDAVIKILSPNDESVIIDMGKATAEKQLVGIYRVLLKLTSPTFIMKKAAYIYKLIYDEGRAAVNIISPKSASITYYGFSEKHKSIELTSLGFCMRAMELSGAKNVVGKITKSVSQGQGCFEITGTWD